MVTGLFLYPNGLATSSCTYITPLLPSPQEITVGQNIFVLVWKLSGLYICNYSGKEAEAACEIIQGCVDSRQPGHLGIMNVMSSLVFYVLELLCLSPKVF